MSENITHTAIVDDCARLALHDRRIGEPFQQVLREQLEIARLGGITRSGDRFTADLLERFRRRWPEEGGEEGLRRKLAFVLGWLCHRAADRQMKPIWRSMPSQTASPTECSIYHDVFLFREVYRCGHRGPYSPQVLEEAPDRSATDGSRQDEVEQLLRTYWRRALLSLHTFKPDSDDIEGWLERLFDARQRFRVEIRRYAEALANPDPQKVRRFIEEVNFYDASEPLIRFARSVQRGAPEESIDLDEAFEAAAEGSQYARALRRGLGYLRAGSAFFEGRLERDVLEDRLDIGKPGG